MTPSRFFTIYWIVWALVTVTGFLVAEIYALITNWQDTLSANIWRFEHFDPRQSVMQWTFAHFIFIALLLVLDVWLLGHFGWGKWR